MLPDSANPVELTWTIVSAVGALLALVLCWDVVRDARDILRDHTNGVKRRATFLCIGITAFFTYGLTTFVVIGCFAMTAPQPPGGAFATPTQIALTVGFVSIAVAASVICIWWRIVRHYARRSGYRLPDTAIPPSEGVH
jgi:hypothetical protein